MARMAVIHCDEHGDQTGSCPACQALEAKPTQRTGLYKVECTVCGEVDRVTKKWLVQAVGDTVSVKDRTCGWTECRGEVAIEERLFLDYPNIKREAYA